MNFYTIDCFNFTLAAASVVLRNGSDKFAEDLDGLVFSMIRNIKNRLPEGKWYAVWDAAGGTTFRKNIDSEYKADRDTSAIDFEAIISCSRLFKLYDMQNISMEQTEADDTIAVLCKALRDTYLDANITIISRDRDLIQVVQNGWADALYDFSQKKNVNIPDYSIVDFKALVGDRSDHIKGLPKVGEKTAIKILAGERTLSTEEQVLFEKYKDIIDTRRHPLFEKNYSQALELIN